MMMYMHRTQEKLLTLIKRKNLSGMSLRDIGEGIGEKSPQKIKHHLSQLAKKGFISYKPANRQINILKRTDKSGSFVLIPIVGTADCGIPTKFADENVEGYLRVSKKLIPRAKKLIILRASGDSMNKADVSGDNIEDGDFVLIDPTKQDPEDGKYVVSVIDDVANIKKFERDEKNKRIVLRSESTSEYLPIYIHEEDKYCISGTVVGVVKQ